MFGIRVRRSLKAGAFATSAVLGGPATASGFVRPPTGSCVYNGYSTLQYYFLNNTTYSWSNPNVLASWNSGANDWESLRGAGSSTVALAPPLMAITNVSTRVTVNPPDNYFEVQAVPVLQPNGEPNDFSGATNCANSPHTIKIRSDYLANLNMVRYVATHETGHAMGLRHTGKHDNLTSASGLPDESTVGPTGSAAIGVTPAPVMSNCEVPTGFEFYRPKFDDWASLNHKRSGALSNASPDGGFESGLNVIYSSGSVTRDSQVRDTGLYSGRISDVGSIHQRVRITTPAASAASFGARYKSNGGAGNFKAMVHPVDYSSGCQYNSPFYPTGSAWVIVGNHSLVAANSFTTTPTTTSSSTVRAINVAQTGTPRT